MPRKSKGFQGLYRMPESKFWWFRWTKNGQRFARSLKTDDEAEAITRAQAILAEGLIATEAYTPDKSSTRKHEIHGLIDLYLKDAQERNKKPLRPETANVRRYILNKFVSDCGINQVGEITLPKIQSWLTRLKAEGKAKDTVWGNGQRVRSFVTYLVSKKYLPASILTDFTVPEQAAAGRKNWIRKDEVTRISKRLLAIQYSNSRFWPVSIVDFAEMKFLKPASVGSIWKTRCLTFAIMEHS